MRKKRFSLQQNLISVAVLMHQFSFDFLLWKWVYPCWRFYIMFLQKKKKKKSIRLECFCMFSATASFSPPPPHAWTCVHVDSFPALWDQNAFVEKQLLAAGHTTDWFIEFYALAFAHACVCVWEFCALCLIMECHERMSLLFADNGWLLWSTCAHTHVV